MTNTTRPLMLAAAAALLAACTRETTMPMASAGSIEGVLRDTSGAALDEASVRLRNPGTGTDLRATLTDSAGHYEFAALPPGTYSVFLVVPAATALPDANPRSVTVAANRTTPADFTFTLLPVSFSRHVQPVLRAACTGCHSPAGGAPMGLNLTPPRARELTVGVTSAEYPTMERIRARHPESSYLVHKIQGTQLTAGGGGAQMPQGFPPLPNQTIRMIRRWIAQGAPRN